MGIAPRQVSVQARASSKGKEGRFTIVGLPDTAIREAVERVRAAVFASGRTLSNTVVVNLAPSDLRKEGSAFDLPIALAALGAGGVLDGRLVVAVGELALDGAVRGTRNALAAALVAKRIGALCVVPADAEQIVAEVEDVEICVVTSLAEAIDVALVGSGRRPTTEPVAREEQIVDLSVVRGQEQARRALELAAAGGHHLLLSGPPGSGKSLLASCMPGILPPLSSEEALEVALAWGGTRRAAGMRTPPFRAPHHSASYAALFGGGSGIPVVGEISRAHRGVLYLDELGEFPPSLIDGLRQPIESGRISIARKGVTITFPARFQLVASTNPCPCGWLGDRTKSCSCGPSQLERYKRRLSGPIADRFDIRVAVEAVDADEMLGGPGESSEAVRERVLGARAHQGERGALNRELERTELDALAWEEEGVSLLKEGLARGVLTGRGYDRVRRLARTIADLDEAEQASEDHVAEAMMLRGSL